MAVQTSSCLDAVQHEGGCPARPGTASPECLRCGQRVGWVGIGVNLAMVILKVIVGLTAGSRACLADALHSSTNIVTAFAIFISRRLTGKPEDDCHPYGHGKVEFIAAGAVSVVIMMITLVLVITSLEHILHKPVPPPHMTALVVGLISIAANEMMFRYFRCVGTQLRSQTILANAWANRADCFSSAAVVAGVIGSRFGFHHLDPIAALVVAGVIIKVCIGGVREAVAGLMDRSVPVGTLKTMRRLLLNNDQVQGLGYLRARWMGDKIWIEVSLQVAPEHTVSACDRIADQVRRALIKGIPGVTEVMVDFVAAKGTSR